MKISQLLNEAEDQDSKDLKPSQQLLPQQEPDADQPPSEDDQSQIDPAVDALAKISSKIGPDLYSTTIWNYYEIFDGADAIIDSPILTALQAVAKQSPENKEVYQAYRSYKGNAVAQERLVSNIILNTRNGRIMNFVADPTDEAFFGQGQPGELVTAGLIDQDQASTLNKILDAGRAYVTAVGSDAGWEPGTSTAKINRAQSKLFDRLNTSALSFEDPNIHDPEYQDYLERRKKSKERMKRRWAEKRAAAAEQAKTDAIKKRLGK